MSESAREPQPLLSLTCPNPAHTMASRKVRQAILCSIVELLRVREALSTGPRQFLFLVVPTLDWRS